MNDLEFAGICWAFLIGGVIICVIFMKKASKSSEEVLHYTKEKNLHLFANSTDSPTELERSMSLPVLKCSPHVCQEPEHVLKLLESSPGSFSEDKLASLPKSMMVNKREIFGPSSRFKILVCHDMKGNYLKDRFHYGSACLFPFQFFYWDFCDIFCYFSHNMITIPPLSWINCAHHHGRKIIGTFIAEWDEGSEACKQIFVSQQSSCEFAHKLVQYALLLGFDGWLINIECKLSKDIEVPNMIIFLHELRRGLHDINSENVLIW